MVVDHVSPTLLRWYDTHARRLPWRSPPGTPAPEPYRVWLSEIMLQQTTVAAVGPYFARFTALWPTVVSLAEADDSDVMREWAGLGYYARARNLLACARVVVAVHGGHFPPGEAELRALPGIGAYTAAAVAAIAFGQRAVVVDGNVERVVSRLFGVATPLPQARKTLHADAARLTPEARAGDHAQAMMDLGATICTPRIPQCPLCPVSAMCAAFAEGDPGRYPVKLAKKLRPVRYGTAFWIEHDGEVLLVRRPPSGLLGGMLALPSSVWQSEIDVAPPPTTAGRWRLMATTVRHIFTHFELRLSVAVAHPTARPVMEGEWFPVARIGAAGLPTLFDRAAQLVLRERADDDCFPRLQFEDIG